MTYGLHRRPVYSAPPSSSVMTGRSLSACTGRLFPWKSAVKAPDRRGIDAEMNIGSTGLLADGEILVHVSRRIGLWLSKTDRHSSGHKSKTLPEKLGSPRAGVNAKRSYQFFADLDLLPAPLILFVR